MESVKRLREDYAKECNGEMCDSCGGDIGIANLKAFQKSNAQHSVVNASVDTIVSSGLHEQWKKGGATLFAVCPQRAEDHGSTKE